MNHPVEAEPALVVAGIMDLFAQYGDEDYDGEPVSQASHMIQCGMLAIKENAGAELVLGAFLHDIGHLLKHTHATTAMGTFGVVNHEGLGSAFLRNRGFSGRICAVVGGHVRAKRYLVATNPAYRDQLSHASLETLVWQGGPMQPDEVASFEQEPYFQDILKVRMWDEQAKDTHADLIDLNYFENLMHEHLQFQQQQNEARD